MVGHNWFTYPIIVKINFREFISMVIGYLKINEYKTFKINLEPKYCCNDGPMAQWHPYWQYSMFIILDRNSAPVMKHTWKMFTEDQFLGSYDYLATKEHAETFNWNIQTMRLAQPTENTKLSYLIQNAPLHTTILHHFAVLVHCNQTRQHHTASQLAFPTAMAV